MQIPQTGGGEGGAAAPSTLFLHSCCAPCSSSVLELLSRFFRITVFYWNPNIHPEGEYRKRAAEQRRFLEEYQAERTSSSGAGRETCGRSFWEEQGRHMERTDGSRAARFRIGLIEGHYEPERFLELSRGLETCPEGGERCWRCYEWRLRETARRAAENGSDFFCATLTVSPLKNAARINEIGERLSLEYGVRWLPCDFKKKGGYQRSIELSKQYGLYRQAYCGCVFSDNANAANRRKEEQETNGEVHGHLVGGNARNL
ncbi:MAG: epoxyqueuosine reductase QueH [Clostridium sp.]|nr:epoxyqueuosine reductase QueH [Clostridium sp.]